MSCKKSHSTFQLPIHIMKSLLYLKSKVLGTLGTYSNIFRHSGFTACTCVTRPYWNVCEWSLSSLSMACQSGSGSVGGKKRWCWRKWGCWEFLLCHSVEQEIMSALSGLICLIWGQRLRPSRKVGQHGISAPQWMQRVFNLNSATQRHRRRRRCQRQAKAPPWNGHLRA